MTTIDIPDELILERIEDRPAELDDGTFRCPVCPRTFKSRNAVGPHKLSHMRQIGLAAPRAKQGFRRNQTIACPRCPTRLQPSSLASHLEGVHELSYKEARQVAAEARVNARTSETPLKAPESAEEPSKVPAVRKKMNGTHAPAPHLSPDDAVVGVLLGLSGTDMVRIVDVPEIARWVQHTHHVASLVNGTD